MDNFSEACLASCDKWLSSYPDTEAFAFSSHFNRRMKILTDKMRKDRYHRLTRKTVCAIIAAALIAAITVTTFAVPSSREYIIEEFSDHFSYKTESTNFVRKLDSLNIGYIPEGFEKTDEYYLTTEICIVYQKDDIWFTVSKYTIDTEIDIDLSPRETKIINGNEYLIFTTDSTNGIIWNNGSYIYMVSGSANKDEILNIALNME